jgi:hypothetical protein
MNKKPISTEAMKNWFEGLQTTIKTGSKLF